MCGMVCIFNVCFLVVNATYFIAVETVANRVILENVVELILLFKPYIKTKLTIV